MKRNIHLLAIDTQNDFCDITASQLPNDLEGKVVNPALPVTGAHADMQRLGDLVQRGLKGISDISVTMDSHHHLGIERPTFWMDGSGGPVNPFTLITAKDVRDGTYLPKNPAATPRVLAYLDTLEAAGRYNLMIWPVHCEIGTWGHNIHENFRKAYNVWEEREFGVVNKVTKGSNPWTEHYSALLAEVPDPMDPSTQLNRGLIDILEASDQVVIAGEAGSHCVKATVEHIVEYFDVKSVSKLVILTDCISPVAGFEQQYKDFLTDMAGKGVQMSTASDFLPELISNSRK
jgi:nicotinamidase/pyrazinamidase